MFALKTRSLVHTHPTRCVVMQFCARGSMYDVLAKARTSPLLAQQLDWPKRVSMALDAAKVGRFTFCCASTLHAIHHYRDSSVRAKGMCSVSACEGLHIAINKSCAAGPLSCQICCSVLVTLIAAACSARTSLCTT